MGVNLMPSQAAATATSVGGQDYPGGSPVASKYGGQEDYSGGSPVASKHGGVETGLLESADRRDISGSSTVAQPEPTSGYQQ